MKIEKSNINGVDFYYRGGNVGAFALLACSKGAEVTVYEPDPYNCEMIKKNLALNVFCYAKN